MIILHKHVNLKFFDLLDAEMVTLLTKMSKIQVYQENDGQKIPVRHGVIVLFGALKLCEENKEKYASCAQEIKSVNYYQADPKGCEY